MSHDERFKKNVGDDRADRAMQDRAVTENREMSDDDRFAMFQGNNTVLPDLPKIAGYHVCWLSTTNAQDSIHRRLMQGYEPIKQSDILGFDHLSIKTGEWAGSVGVHEMLAYKLPMRLYQRYMTEAHHNMPLREEEILQDQERQIKEQVKKAKGRVDAELSDDLTRSTRAPIFEAG